MRCSRPVTAILGNSALYHDSAAALLVDGRIVAAAQEERFTRRKHDAGFPAHAIAYVLDEGGLDLASVDHVAFYDKPFLKFERLLESYLAYAPRGFNSFRMAMPVWLREKLFLKDLLKRELRPFPTRVSPWTSCCSPNITSAMPPVPSTRHPSKKRWC